MSVVTTSGIQTIHVRLLDEGVEVWRPAQAIEVGVDRYRLSEQAIPDDESWEFLPGDEVVTDRRGSGPDAFVAAIGRSGRGASLGRRSAYRS